MQQLLAAGGGGAPPPGIPPIPAAEPAGMGTAANTIPLGVPGGAPPMPPPGMM